jgi:DNA-binding protein Fis
MSPIPAERIVTEVRQFLAGQLEREGILLQIKADSSVWIDADPQQMKQVLINLLRNAVEAIEGAGALILARPFGVGLEHVRQVVEKNRQPMASGKQSHAAYVADLLARVQRGEEQAAYAKMIADLEPELFSQAIQLAQGNQAKAARWLGVTRLKMREKLTELGLHPAREK